MLIAVDAAGGENAPREIVKGAIKAAQDSDVEIALVGNKAVLHVLAGREIKKLNLQIFEATEVIGPREHPMRAVMPWSSASVIQYTSMKPTIANTLWIDGSRSSGSPQISNPTSGPRTTPMGTPVGSR